MDAGITLLDLLSESLEVLICSSTYKSLWKWTFGDERVSGRWIREEKVGLSSLWAEDALHVPVRVLIMARFGCAIRKWTWSHKCARHKARERVVLLQGSVLERVSILERFC